MTDTNLRLKFIKLPLLYNYLCLKQLFENPTFSRDSLRLSFVTSACRFLAPTCDISCFWGLAVQEISPKCAYFTRHILLETKIDKIKQRITNSMICMRGSQECVYENEKTPTAP